MLTSRRLDDQSFEEIVAEARERLPWLCPVWTDHNAHDPGITFLELMAWYKEMQQYHMDQMTPAIRWKLLELAGLRRMEEREARCALEIPPDAPARLALSRLSNPQEIPFELLEPVPAVRPRLARVLLERGEERLDAADLLAGGTSLLAFAFGGEESRLLLGFDRKPDGPLRLWFQVEQPRGTVRNPVEWPMEPPRTLQWELEGLGAVQPLADETWSLSWSGYVTLPAAGEWPRGQEGLYWLRLSQTAFGCEEQVRLAGVSAGRFRCAQQESRACSHTFEIGSGPEQRVTVESAQAREAELAVFLRTPQGWEQTAQYTRRWEAAGLCLEVDGSRSAQDGADNLMVACLNPTRVHDLLFDARGIPGERFYLNLEGRRALPERLSLMCQTAEQSGASRPAPWRCVEDLSLYGPRDRVFEYDPARETITFGDGTHGAMVAPGEGAVLVTGLVLSLCGDGNIPADAGLCFEEDASPVRNSAASGGRNREDLAGARGRLLRQLDQTKKCLSTRDYEQRARETPGLRVAAARALPGYDPDAAGTTGRAATVSVVVLPDTCQARPMPDSRFLAAVDRQLDRCRPICIRARAIPPRYVPISVSVQLMVSGTGEDPVRQMLESSFSAREERIGRTVSRDEISVALQKVPGVLQVRKLDLRGLDQNSCQTAAGDLRLPPDGIAVPERIGIELIRA